MRDDKYFGASMDICTSPNRNMRISFTIHLCDGIVLRTIDLACAPLTCSTIE